MRKIGGFFELELDTKAEYHPNSLKLNTGRNAFEYLLRAKNYKKVHLPHYICHSILEPIKKLGLEYSFYKINERFEALFDFSSLKDSEIFLYVNYFGVCELNVQHYADLSKEMEFNICIDNTQSFFSLPFKDIDTFYSARKFFGVPDGAYLYTNQYLSSTWEHEIGYDKSLHLLKRFDLGPKLAYEDYKNASSKHIGQKIKKMSKLSESILASINYSSIKQRRLNNFKYLNTQLKEINSLQFNLDHLNAPMVYPLFLNIEGLRDYLISNNVFVATYWPEVLRNVDEDQFEKTLVDNILPIPIDQRYNIEDMEYIIDLIFKYIKEVGYSYEK